MCRLFGMTAGTAEVHATFWLLDAPDSMADQNVRNADGAGIGWFDVDGVAHLRKRPGEALADKGLRERAEEVDVVSVVTHVRAATAGSDNIDNCHPFEMDGLLVAHNGGFSDLKAVEAQLGDYRDLVHGDTDSERYAALIAKETSVHDGDVGAGIVAAADWLRTHVPLYSLNTVVISKDGMWALRYPDQRALHIARRVVHPGTGAPDDGWQGSSSLAGHQVVGTSETPIVVVASERVDDSPDWLMLQPGELIAVDRELTITSRLALHGPPKQLLVLSEKDPNRESF